MIAPHKAAVGWIGAFTVSAAMWAGIIKVIKGVLR